MGVSKNRGTPKWMVKIIWMIWVENPLFFGNPHMKHPRKPTRLSFFSPGKFPCFFFEKRKTQRQGHRSKASELLRCAETLWGVSLRPWSLHVYNDRFGAHLVDEHGFVRGARCLKWKSPSSNRYPKIFCVLPLWENSKCFLLMSKCVFQFCQHPKCLDLVDSLKV